MSNTVEKAAPDEVFGAELDRWCDTTLQWYSMMARKSDANDPVIDECQRRRELRQNGETQVEMTYEERREMYHWCMVLTTLQPWANDRYPHTDIGAGLLAGDVLIDRARFCPETKCFWNYDGKRWVPDPTGVRTADYLQKIALALRDVCYKLHSTDNLVPKEVLKSFRDYTKRWQSNSFRRHVLDDMRPVNMFHLEDCDADPLKFNVQNGTLSLRNGKLLSHDPDDLITKLSPVEYIPGASSPLFDCFIAQITEGPDVETGKIGERPDLAEYLQELFGYCLTGSTRYEGFWCLYGPTTRNGKSTLVEAVLHMMGDYGTTVSPESLALNKRTAGSASADIVALRGRRLVVAPEPAEGMRLDAAQIKSMTGGDHITARPLYGNPISFKPAFKLVMNANYLPLTDDTTLFSSGRARVVPFDRHFEQHEQNPTLKAELMEDDVQAAILEWAVQGCLAVMEYGFIDSQEVRDAISAYSGESDKIGQFLAECTEPSETGYVRKDVLYQAYADYCKRNGFGCESSTRFKAKVRGRLREARFVDESTGRKQRVYAGLQLRPLSFDGDFEVVDGGAQLQPAPTPDPAEIG